MWPVSERFLNTITSSPHYLTSATFTTPGGVATPVAVSGGTVTVDSSQNVRRTASLSLVGDSNVYARIMTPGTVFHIDHGLDYGNSTELLPVFHGEITSGQQVFGGQTINVSCSDQAVRLARSTFITPYIPTVTLRRSQVITNMVNAELPSVLVNSATSDKETVGAANWLNSRLDVLTDLSKDGSIEAFFLPDGSFIIRDRPVLDSSPTWLTRSVTSATRTRPMDQLYNTVVVQPAATDGSQTWTQQTVTITDTSSPIHPSKIGTAVYVYPSTTIKTASNAIATGRTILNRFMGVTESLALTGIANPALEASDVITVIVPGVGMEPPQSFRHFIDAYTIDLATGSMTLNTRTTSLV